MKLMNSNRIVDKSNYVAEINTVNESEWNTILDKFDDATIYQTWEYGSIQWGENNLSHIVIKQGNKIIGAAQCRIIKLPFLKTSILYIMWGPMWHVYNQDITPDNFRSVIRAIYQEYVVNRNYIVRLNSPDFNMNNKELRHIIKDEGFYEQLSISSYRTLVNDLNPPLEDLLMGLKKKWRENLRRAKRNGLNIIEGTNDDLYSAFIALYQEMHKRKRFAEFVDINKFRNIQKRLANNQKMKILICEHKGKPISGLIYSSIGMRGIPIFSATGNDGMKLRGSYLLRWHMLEQLKEKRCLYFDQGGINPLNNPGGFHFKSGMGGIEVSHLGYFDAYQSVNIYNLFILSNYIRNIYRTFKIKYSKRKLAIW